MTGCYVQRWSWLQSKRCEINKIALIFLRLLKIKKTTQHYTQDGFN
jgi:hypothetical protein